MIAHFFAQLPALPVILPLLAAPLCVLLRHATLAWLTYCAVSLAVFGISLLLLVQVHVGIPISYAMGGWAPPVGIELRIDTLNAFVLVSSVLLLGFVQGFLQGLHQGLSQDLFHLFHQGLLG